MYLATYVAETEEDFYNFDVTPQHNNAFSRLLQDPKQLQVSANSNMLTPTYILIYGVRCGKSSLSLLERNRIE